MTTTHNNIVTINSSAIETIVVTNLVISPDQPSNLPFVKPPTEETPGVWQIEVDCGRSASSSIAADFNAAVGSSYHLFTAPYVDGAEVSTPQPDALNFYIAAKMYFTGLTHYVNLYFGQGSIVHVANNWWIGGDAILNSSPGNSTMCFLMVDRRNIFTVNPGYRTSGSQEGTPIDSEFVLTTGPK